VLTRFKNKNVLLLQGPLGPFFKRFSKDLKEAGAHVIKINFCGGDSLFYKGKEVVKYRDTLYNWPLFLQSFIKKKNIDTIFLLGDFRPYHIRAKDIATSSGTELYVFEEGYLRPDYITLEKGGVNGNSSMPSDPHFYLQQNLNPKKNIIPVGPTFTNSAIFAILYYVSTALLSWRYSNYVHHRPRGIYHHSKSWVKSFFRKHIYRISEKHFLKELTTIWSGKFFLFPLQVHNDYQFKHAKYDSIESCIEDVFISFSTDAPKDNLLVIKHHPADRPYRDYSDLIKNFEVKYHMQGRVIYIHDLHLPTLLRHSKGTIVMNSTVGLSSLHHNTPVKVLGRAIYNIDGLTHKGTLKEFWNNPGTIDKQLYHKFRGWLEHNNQINGSFYRKIKGANSHAGVIWL
jgi:capsule polysaccharide modification protein KpsS